MLETKKFLEMAKIVSCMSEDPNTKTGAIIVNKAGEIVARGYNHLPVSEGNGITWNRVGEYLNTKYPYVVHAEVACCIEFLRYLGANPSANPEDYTMYITLFPCEHCAQMILESGIKKFYYADDKYHDKEFSIAARKLFDAADVEYIYQPIEEEEMK